MDLRADAHRCHLSIAWTDGSCTETMSIYMLLPRSRPPAHTPRTHLKLWSRAGCPLYLCPLLGSVPPDFSLDPLIGRIDGVPSSPGFYTFVCRIYESRFPPFSVERTFVNTVTPT
ncbi:MAG: hypothetical protein V2G42_02000 [bacterium JZ-2024 1]